MLRKEILCSPQAVMLLLSLLASQIVGSIKNTVSISILVLILALVITGRSSLSKTQEKRSDKKVMISVDIGQPRDSSNKKNQIKDGTVQYRSSILMRF